jgi:hypothetical protein
MGNPPVSHLAWMVSALQGGSLPGALGTPLNSMFRGAAEPAAHARLGSQRESRGEDSASGPPYTNNQVHVKLAEVTANARRCSPTVNFRKVLAVVAAPKPQLSSLQLSRGRCFDYLFFGKCNSPCCTFQHTGGLVEAKIDGVISKMRARWPSSSPRTKPTGPRRRCKQGTSLVGPWTAAPRASRCQEKLRQQDEQGESRRSRNR